ncbi:MAG TPA: LysE family translocator, partial [Actinomycetota bacterium]|nr:LysE family translocator [Actinomycetota bacterium]
NRAWKTSWMPGTAGFHAWTHSRSAPKTRRSYKTAAPASVFDGSDADRGATEPAVNELVGLVAFAFAGSASPGPNNAVLWASGMRFGFRRTIPHIAGTALGIGVLVVGVAAGIGVLLRAVPGLELGLKLAASAYLLRVAFLVAGSGAVGRGSTSRPLTVRQAIAFQCVNAKAWVFAVAAVGAFLPPDLPRPVGVLMTTAVLMVVVAASASIWAAGGSALGRIVDDDGKRRAVGIALAVLLVASVVLVWV